MYKIQLNEHQYIDGINVDTTIKLPLQSNKDLNIEYDIQNVLDVTQVFDAERQESKKYRIHGEFEYLSILNGLPIDYTLLSDFFSLTPLSADTKNLYTDLKVYLVKPSTSFNELISNKRYVKNYEIIADVTNVEFFNSGFATNIYSEQQNTYVVNIDSNITDQYDGLNFPITELALYVEYQPQDNGNNVAETIQRKTYNSTGGDGTKQTFTPTQLFVGEIITGDVIDYEKELYLQENYIYNDKPQLMEHYVSTTYKNTPTSSNKVLKWKYNPFIPIRLRYFQDDVIRGNTGSTSYEVISNIPPFATEIDTDGNFVWRNLLDNGFIDPITEEGVSFPFINQRHYVFSNIIFKMQPDLGDTNTNNVFDEILFAQNNLINAEPNSSLDNIGEICN